MIAIGGHFNAFYMLKCYFGFVILDSYINLLDIATIMIIVKEK